MENIEKISYKFLKSRRKMPQCLPMTCKLVEVSKKPFNIKEKTVELTDLISRLSIEFSLENFEHFLHFQYSNDLDCYVSEYTYDAIWDGNFFTN